MTSTVVAGTHVFLLGQVPAQADLIPIKMSHQRYHSESTVVLTADSSKERRAVDRHAQVYRYEGPVGRSNQHILQLLKCGNEMDCSQGGMEMGRGRTRPRFRLRKIWNQIVCFARKTQQHQGRPTSGECAREAQNLANLRGKK